MEKFKYVLICSCITAFVTCTPALAQEPSQSDMRDAINKNFAPLQEDINYYANSCSELRKKLKTREKNESSKLLRQRGYNLETGLYCSYFSNVEGISIKKIKKIACEKAVGKPGYVCDYFIDIIVKDASSDTIDDKQNSKVESFRVSYVNIKDVIENKFFGVQTSRFVYDGKDWLMIEQFDFSANTTGIRQQ